MKTSLKSLLLLSLMLTVLAAGARAQWTWTPQTGRWVNIKNLPKETPELQVEYARSLMMEGEYRKALRETSKFFKFYGDAPEADRNQFLRGEIMMAQGDLMKAAKEFQQVLSAYPDTDLYEKAIEKQYEIGDIYYEKGQRQVKKRWALFKKRPLNRAIKVYAMVVENQPFTAAAAEAQYKMGLCHYTRGEYFEAAWEYRRVVEDYSGSGWVDEAKYGLAMSYYEMAKPPAYDQTPGKLAVEHIDSFVNNYPEDPRTAELAARREEMREAMAEQRLNTARFYEKRRDFDAARLYYRVLTEQFSDTSPAGEAEAWLAEHPESMSEARRAVRALREES
jgi:outer membrane protein assembly factor BamD